MTVLFGHPTGNPNSHNAALAHFEANVLEAFCVPWMPTHASLEFLKRLPFSERYALRLSRRGFRRLEEAPKIQGRISELKRLVGRALFSGNESAAFAANDWLMHTMARECARPSVRAVHAYEDCSYLQFVEATRLGKACIYDLVIGYYPAWERTQDRLTQEFGDWLGPRSARPVNCVRRRQKIEEMALADLVLVPGTFVQNTVAEFLPQKKVALAPYGVDLDFWRGVPKQENRSFRFVFAGQVSVRKGTPLLLQAWRKAGLREAELQLIGSWRLADSVRRETPAGVRWIPPLSYPKLRAAYQSADVFVLPSYFEGLALALLEALACELPAIATEAAAGSELELDKCGRLLRTGHVDDLVDALRWCHANQDEVARMKGVARRTAERFTWERYRSAVTEAAAPFA